MARLALVGQQTFVDTETGVVTVEWTNGIPPGYPDAVNWEADTRVELVLPGVAVIAPIRMPIETPELEVEVEMPEVETGV